MIATAISIGAASVAQAQDTNVYEEQHKYVNTRGLTEPLGPNLFGDQISTYQGALRFNQTDLTLPGNSALPVHVARRLVSGRGGARNLYFGDWDLDLPSINGVFATGASTYGANYGFANDTGYEPDVFKRCTYFDEPPQGYPNKGLSVWMGYEYWAGTSLNIPGHGEQEIVQRGATNTLKPSDGQDYRLVTKAGWQIRCLPSLHPSNAKSTGLICGEGFLAVSPEGVQYRFDWMVMRPVMSLVKWRNGSLDRLFRHEFLIFPTLVTDRHGNTVTYEFDAATPLQIKRVSSSDGRTLTFSYHAGSNRIASASDGTRTVTYTYATDGTNSLSRVGLGDGSAWQFNLQPLWAGVSYQGPPTTCTSTGSGYENEQVGNMVHPSGATGTFTTRGVLNGRKVATACPADAGGASWSFKPRWYVTRSLVHKAISGPGIGTLAWTYAYPAAVGSDVTCTTCPDTKVVTVTDARGFTLRQTYGIRASVNEGQLLAVEEGSISGGAPLSTTALAYRASNVGPYPELVATAKTCAATRCPRTTRRWQAEPPHGRA